MTDSLGSVARLTPCGQRSDRGCFACLTAHSGHLPPCGGGRLARSTREPGGGYLLCCTKHPPPHPSPSRGDGGDFGSLLQTNSYRFWGEEWRRERAGTLAQAARRGAEAHG